MTDVFQQKIFDQEEFDYLQANYHLLNDQIRQTLEYPKFTNIIQWQVGDPSNLAGRLYCWNDKKDPKIQFDCPGCYKRFFITNCRFVSECHVCKKTTCPACSNARFCNKSTPACHDWVYMCPEHYYNNIYACPKHPLMMEKTQIQQFDFSLLPNLKMLF